MKLLLTGFEPFGGSSLNPAEQIVRALAHEQFAGIELATAILPVDRVRGPAALLRAFDDACPDAVMCLGEATRRAVISVERVAINLLDYRIADNAGNQTVDEPIVRGAPDAYFTTLPVRALCDAINAAGVPAELSLSAGAFLCNQVTFVLLHHLVERGLKTPAGFIHVPALPEQVIGKTPSLPSMGLPTLLTGIRAAMHAL